MGWSAQRWLTDEAVDEGRRLRERICLLVTFHIWDVVLGVTTTDTRLDTLSEPEPLGPITFGKSRNDSIILSPFKLAGCWTRSRSEQASRTPGVQVRLQRFTAVKGEFWCFYSRALGPVDPLSCSLTQQLRRSESSWRQDDLGVSES